jgi:hypothetical protein
LAFEARNLRVQLPCGPVTVIQCRFETDFCALPSRFCTWPTRWCGWFTCPLGSCLDTFVGCRIGTQSPCGYASPVVDLPVCAAGSEPLQPVTHVSVEDLATLREQLQAQLKEVQAAEKQVEAYRKAQG